MSGFGGASLIPLVSLSLFSCLCLGTALLISQLKVTSRKSPKCSFVDEEFNSHRGY